MPNDDPGRDRHERAEKPASPCRTAPEPSGYRGPCKDSNDAQGDALRGLEREERENNRPDNDAEGNSDAGQAREAREHDPRK